MLKMLTKLNAHRIFLILILDCRITFRRNLMDQNQSYFQRLSLRTKMMKLFLISVILLAAVLVDRVNTLDIRYLLQGVSISELTKSADLKHILSKTYGIYREIDDIKDEEGEKLIRAIEDIPVSCIIDGESIGLVRVKVVVSIEFLLIFDFISSLLEW